MEVMGIDLAKLGTAIGYTIGVFIGLILLGYLVYFFSKLQMKAWINEIVKHINEQNGKEEKH